MKRKHKIYSKPKRPFDKVRIDEEAQITKEFGLKNKKEIWRAEAQIKSIREKAKKLISASQEEQKKLFDNLNKIGLNVESIADILSLDKKDYLKRRLQTVMVEKKLATTSKSARQLITHRKVFVDGKIIDSPSYIVPTSVENKITLKVMKMKAKKKETKDSIEEIKTEEKPVANEEKSEEVKEESTPKQEENKE